MIFAKKSAGNASKKPSYEYDARLGRWPNACMCRLLQDVCSATERLMTWQSLFPQNLRLHARMYVLTKRYDENER